MITSKYCSNCGKPIFVEDKSCGNCGTKVSSIKECTDKHCNDIGNICKKIYSVSIGLLVWIFIIRTIWGGLSKDEAMFSHGFWISAFFLSVWLFLPADKLSSKVMFLKTINIRRSVIIFIYVVWLILSFILSYYLTVNGCLPKWMFFSSAFLSYLIYFQSISIIGLIYILTNGKFSETKKHIRTIIIATAILTVFAFTLIRWTTLTTNYGQYGHNVKYAAILQDSFFINYGGDTNFEKETIYREAVRFKYDVAFQQIWIFGFFIFTSVMLILMVIDKKEYNQPNRRNE